MQKKKKKDFVYPVTFGGFYQGLDVFSLSLKYLTGYTASSNIKHKVFMFFGKLGRFVLFSKDKYLFCWDLYGSSLCVCFLLLIKKQKKKQWPLVTNEYLSKEKKKWIEAGKKRSELMKYHSCENPPMFPLYADYPKMSM